MSTPENYLPYGTILCRSTRVYGMLFRILLCPINVPGIYLQFWNQENGQGTSVAPVVVQMLCTPPSYP